jgi:asparagine synthase (glutamine-hydrolysing)
MCGITGCIAFRDAGLKRLDQVELSVHKLRQRGPDGNGVFRHNHVALGHARLSIIDTSTNGAQPFSDESGRYTLVFNGEFFNFKPYRQQLESAGIRFRSESDTEVLLHLLIREGSSCIEKINGFFAFAFYDRETGTVLIARDRYGEKPLVWMQDDDGLCFASEMKALLAYSFEKTLDHTSLLHYLHLNYIPAPHSIFEQVQKLEPGHFMEISGNVVRTECWYAMPEKISQPVPTYTEAQKTLREKMEQAVERRMISDVPLGSFLSGGIDSSVVTALASRHTKNLNTFSIGYADEPLFDETRYAQLVASKYGTNHTVFSLRNKDLFDHLHGMLEYIDEPFADSSALAVNILCKETRKYATVALSGDGADELFGGYRKHEGEWNLRNGGIKASVVGMLGPVWDALPASRNSASGNLIRKLRKFSKGLKTNSSERYWNWCGYADESYLKAISAFSSNVQENSARKKYLTRFIGRTGDMNEMLLNDMHLVLPGDMLVKVDLMSMANGLEVRSPFLDYEVVDFAAGLPADYKISDLGRKRIVQDAFRTILPEELYNRPKQGFEVPLLQWFRTDLKSWIFDELLEKKFVEQQGLFRFEGISHLRKQLESGNPGDATARIWALLVFQNWYRQWMK